VKLATLICPNCGQALTVLLIESDGFCACGLDYALHPTSGGMSANVRWTVSAPAASIPPLVGCSA
jgi:uncharacterized protein (DUF983 family)